MCTNIFLSLCLFCSLLMMRVVAPCLRVLTKQLSVPYFQMLLNEAEQLGWLSSIQYARKSMVAAAKKSSNTSELEAMRFDG